MWPRTWFIPVYFIDKKNTIIHLHHQSIQLNISTMAEKKDASAPPANPVKTFLETTSVKGVPRMMKSRSVIFRILWGLSVLLGAFIAGYFLVKLFMLYFSHKVTMAIKEERAEMKFPSLTLCNLNPIANTKTNVSDMIATFGTFEEVLSDEEVDMENRYLFGQALDPATLFVNFGRDNGLKARDFLVSCRWDSDTIESEESCVESAQRYLYQTSYGYCFTLEPPENSSFIYGFSVILYIDDTFRVPVPSFELNLGRPFASGAVLAAHLRDSPPNIEQGVILESGMSTEVHVTQTRRVQLEAPYPSNCSNNPNMPEPDHVYTSESCRALCRQNEVIRKCGCVDGIALSVPSQFTGNIDFCRKIDRSAQDVYEAFAAFANRSQCIRSVLIDNDLCENVCPVECVEERYELTSAEIEWPHPTMQLAFYKRYIKEKPYQHRFETYQNLSERMDNNSADVHDFYDILSATTMMTDNFLQVSDKLKRQNWPENSIWYGKLRGGVPMEHPSHRLSP